MAGGEFAEVTSQRAPGRLGVLGLVSGEADSSVGMVGMVGRHVEAPPPSAEVWKLPSPSDRIDPLLGMPSG